MFRKLLREARLRAGLTQAQVGEHLGISQLLVSRGEMGDRKTDVIELYEMCEVMGISFADFTRELADALTELHQTQRQQIKKQNSESQSHTQHIPNYGSPSQPERTRRTSPRKPPTSMRKRP